LFHYTVLISLLFSVIQNKKIIICPRGSFSNFTLSNKLSFFKSIWLFVFIQPFYKKVIWQASSYLEEVDILRRLPKAKVEIINDGVDFSSFQNAEQISRENLVEKFTEKSFQEVSRLFLSMGRLHKIKRFDVLIDAFGLYQKEDENAKLIIAGGDDGEEKNLKSQIKNLELESSIFLIGKVDFDEKKLVLNNCDYFTLASEFESFGIVIAEALSCGKAIVLSNKTPWKDLEKNNCGILAENKKEIFYSAFLSVVKQNFDENQIRNYVKSNYDWEEIVKRFIRIIKNN